MAGKKALSAGAARKFEQLRYGAEPAAGSDLSIISAYGAESAFGNALNWYNTFQEPELNEQWITEYLTERKYSTKDIDAIKRGGKLSQSIIHTMRMISNDCIVPARMHSKILEQVTESLQVGRLKHVQLFANRVGPAERNRRKALEFRSDLDYLYDQVWDGTLKVPDIDFFETFKLIGMKPAQASVLIPKYKEILDEEQENDPEVKSSKKNAKARLAFLKELIESLEAWSKGKDEKKEVKVKKKVTERKIGRRIFKSTRPVATAASLKYKKLDEETKLTSINPKQILGAQMLVIFNAKYKQLAIIRAANSEGLSVKGTTILNVDETTSEAKRAGRHMIAIKEMVTAPKTKIAKLFKEIKADLIPFRTRTSEDVVLIRAIK